MKIRSKLEVERYVGWKLVAEQKECGGLEIARAATTDIKECADACYGISSMFIFGTNDFGRTRCDPKCHCFCETAATPDGTCNTVTSDGFRLFTYEKGMIY